MKNYKNHLFKPLAEWKISFFTASLPLCLFASLFLGFGDKAFAEYCCADQVRCRFHGEDSPHSVVGVLYGGSCRDYQFYFGMGCYPSELQNSMTFEPSIKACNEIPACAGDKCYVAKSDNPCPNSCGLTPLNPPHNDCEAYEAACIKEGCAGLQKMPNVYPTVIGHCSRELNDQTYQNCRAFIKDYVKTGYIKCDNPPWWMN